MRSPKQPLQIVFLDFDDIKNPLLAAGQARATVEVGTRLVQKGHKLTVLCSRYPNAKDRVEDGIEYKHIGIGTHNIRLNNLVYILVLPFYVMRLKADIIVEFFTAPISTLMTPLWTKIPVVAVPSSYEAERFTKLYKLPFKTIENFGSRFYKYFLPYTKHLDNKFKAYNPQVISRIVPEGVSESFFMLKRKTHGYILFLGRYDMGQKGIDLLLSAYAKVKKQIGYRLVLAGVGPDKEKIKAIIEKLNLTDSVELRGPAYGAEKDRLLSEALFVAFPSRHEGFSLFALEALASGLPLASFDIPSLSFADSHVALKAPMFDTDAYARVLLSMTNLDLNKQMSANAQTLAKHYSWDNVVKEYEEFFYQMMGEKETASVSDANISVSIGISAHNEEKNIKSLVNALIAQEEKGWKLKEVLIFCDGCIDNTAAEATSSDERIHVTDDGKRLGKVGRIDEFFRHATGDVLVVLDADLKLAHQNIISALVQPFIGDNNVMLTGGNTRPFEPKSFFQAAVYSTFQVFEESRKEMKNGNNIFGCNGGCLAIRKEFAQTIHFPPVINEDDYLYFSCLKAGHRFVHVQEAVVYYKLPNNLSDYLRQNFRSHPNAVKQNFIQYFGTLVNQEYARPPLFMLEAVGKAFVKNPLGVLYISFINIACIPFFPLISKRFKLSWYTAQSTK